jgi:hypothetical protein
VQGIVAQKLPHVGVLLVEPWTVSLPISGREAIQVRIPNAVTYLAQKVLVLRDIGRAIAALFGLVDDRIRRAAIIARETGRGVPPSAELIRARCHDGLQAIFG